MLSDFLNNRYYQYNDFLWIKDEWEDGGDIELLFTKDPNTLTYEDLGIVSINVNDFEIVKILEADPIIKGKKKFYRKKKKKKITP